MSCMQLVQTQTQLSRSLQEQFSCAQTQQSRILELLAPLPQIVQSVPPHINIARNAILEKIPAEGCRCKCITKSSCSGPSIPSAVPSNSTPLSKENLNAEPPFGVRKRRRIDLDTAHPDPNDPLVGGRYQTQSIAVEVRQTHCEFAQKSGETPGPVSVQPQRNTTRATVQTPNDGKKGNDMVPHSYLGSARPEYDNAHVLATRPPARSRGIAPPLVPVILTLNTPYSFSRQTKFLHDFNGKLTFSILG
jgi:hypothetical protein